MTSRPGACRLVSRIASWTIPSSSRGGRAARVLVLGDAEEEDAGDAQLGHLGDRLAEPVERELVLAGHRGDLAAEVRAVVDEQGIDQVVDRQVGSRGPGRGVRDGRGAGGAVERDSRRRVGRAWDDPKRQVVSEVGGQEAEITRSPRWPPATGMPRGDRRRESRRLKWPRLWVGRGKGTSRTSLLLASKHSICRYSAGTLSLKPIWMVMLALGLDPGDLLALAVVQVGGHARADA